VRPGAAAFTTVSGCVAATIRQNGFRGPFQGLGATLVRNTPANAIYLGSFELIKRQAAERYHCPCGPAPAIPRLQRPGVRSPEIMSDSRWKSCALCIAAWSAL
jgi:hypothetical protein